MFFLSFACNYHGIFVSLPTTNEIKPTKPNKIMKKQYLHLICAVCMVVLAYGGIKKCQEREAEAPQSEATAPMMEATAEMTAEEPMDSTQQAYFDRVYFDALSKMADDGKVYALDTKGKRSPKAFKTFDEYEKFITDNPQFHKNSYSYDKDGKDYNVDFKKTTIQED